jgi:hypothetical protein
MPVIVAGLIASGLVLGCAAGAILDRARWRFAHPGTAITCWVGVLAGTFVAVTGMIAVALLWPPAPGHDLLEWLHRCLPGHRHSGAEAATIVSVVLVAACCSRLVRGVPRVWRARARRRRHREMLRIIAYEHDGHPDVLLLDHPVPLAYCLPSRRRPIIVSSGAQERLDKPQLEAVLAHERTHLRRRHHLVLVLLDLAYALLPWPPTLRRARVSLPLLLEMAADDAAARQWGRGALAEALRVLAPPGPAGMLGTLSATGSDGRHLALRLARLDSPAGAPRRGAAAAGWIISACAVAAPLTVFGLAIATIPLPC